MTVGKRYEVTQRIKLHTKPLREADIIKQGRYVRETDKSYCFDNFRVYKSTVVSHKEIK